MCGNSADYKFRPKADIVLSHERHGAPAIGTCAPTDELALKSSSDVESSSNFYYGVKHTAPAHTDCAYTMTNNDTDDDDKHDFAHSDTPRCQSTELETDDVTIEDW